MLFATGFAGAVLKKNAIIVFMCVELMLVGAMLALLSFAAANGDVNGGVYALFVMAIAAAEGGADYVGVGAIFKTATKPDATQGLGLGAIYQVREAVDIPVVAIGGINRGNIQDVIRAGADAAAVVSAVVAQDDVSAAAHELRDLILKVRPHIPPENL